MPVPTPVNPFDKFVRSLIKLLARRLSEQAHTQIIITLRDGKIQLVSEHRNHLPDNLPES